MANLSNINNKFLVTTGGNVGIGNTSPTLSTLAVGIGSTNSPSQICQLAGSGSGVYSVLSLTNTNGTAADNNGVGLDFHVNAAYSATGRIQLIHPTAQSGTTTNSSMQFLTYGTVSGVTTFSPRMTIDYIGNVGIGTTTPQKKLHIEGTGGASEMQILVSSASDTVGHTAGIGLRGEGGEADGDFRIKGGIFFERIAGSFGNGKMILAVNSSVSNTSVTVADHALTIDTNKNVGIGTTSPTLGKLQVSGKGYFGPVGTGDATTKAEMQSNAVLRLKPHDANSTNMNFAQVNSGGGMGIQVTNGPGTANWDIALSPFGGNVGIGTTSPGNLLDVAGDTDITGQLVVSHDANYVAKFVNTATSMSNNNYALMVDSSAHTSNMSTAGAMSVDVDSGRAFTINGLGNVGIGTTSPQTKLEVNGGLIKVVDSGDTAFYGGDYVRVFGTQSYGFRNSAGSSIALISLNGNSYFNGGNVGIGITSPQDKLHVNGDAIISSTRHGDYATASLGTAGVAVAAISASTNGQSAIVEFVASGNNGAYYNVVYSCYNGGGYWYYTKNVVGSGGNIEVAETNGAGSSTLVFYFRTTSGTASYTPRVMMKGMPYNLVTF